MSISINFRFVIVFNVLSVFFQLFMTRASLSTPKINFPRREMSDFYVFSTPCKSTQSEDFNLLAHRDSMPQTGIPLPQYHNPDTEWTNWYSVLLMMNSMQWSSISNFHLVYDIGHYLTHDTLLWNWTLYQCNTLGIKKIYNFTQLDITDTNV